MVVKTEYTTTQLRREESPMSSVEEDHGKCVDLVKHNPGINFCEKCAPLIPGVYRPQALMSTVHSRRAHHELTRQMQNKIAAQNIRDRRKAYAIYLSQGIETLTLDNEARRKRIEEAQAKQATLQEEYEQLKRELEHRQREQTFTDAVMMFELADVDTDRSDSCVDTCVESSDDECVASPSMTDVKSPLLCQYTLDDLSPLPSDSSAVETYDRLSICSIDSPNYFSPLNIDMSTFATADNFDLSSYNPVSLSAR